jgi:nicotinate-nucleotide--dimethylbenzimidazole phosphoribosyltransferase
MTSGGAAVNAIADTVGANVTVVDTGVLTPTPEGAIDAKVRPGTRDLTVEPAMTTDECTAAILAGARAASDRLAAGANLLVTGEVGIGNTTASACLYAAFTGVEPSDVVGKGANNDHTRTPRKVEVVEAALTRHSQADTDALGTLASIGGLEHAALVGVMLAGSAAHVPVIVDGVIAGAAAIAAVEICPDVAGYLIPGHSSAETGGELLAKHLKTTPLLDLGMRLGEGTGALLAVPIVQAAATVLANMATLDDVLG